MPFLTCTTFTCTGTYHCIMVHTITHPYCVQCTMYFIQYCTLQLPLRYHYVKAMYIIHKIYINREYQYSVRYNVRVDIGGWGIHYYPTRALVYIVQCTLYTTATVYSIQYSLLLVLGSSQHQCTYNLRYSTYPFK